MNSGYLQTTIKWSLILTSSMNLLTAPALAGSKTRPKKSNFDRLSRFESSMTDLPQNEELLSQIHSEWGPILKPEEQPALHNLLANLFSELSYAQGRLTEGSSVTINYVHIVDSPIANAFVWTDSKKGIRLFANHLFVTTELLRSMLEGVQLQEGFSRISGIIAHELGHPMDAASAWGEGGGIVIQDHYGSEASQAIEIRADIDAMRILREANYPVDGLYKGLMHLFGKDANQRSSSVGAAASTHPHHDFRLTSAKLFLTLDRLDKGMLSDARNLEALIPNPKEFKKELNQLISKNGRYPYVNPKSMEEVVHRLTNLIRDQDKGYTFKNLEFNRLILSFDEMLLQKQQNKINLTDHELALFDQFLRQVFETTSAEHWQNRLNIYTPKTIRGEITTSSGQSPFAKSPSHFYFIETLEAYKLPIVQSFLREMAETKLNEERFQAEWDIEFSQELFALASLSHPDTFFAQFGEALKGIVKTYYFDPSSMRESGSPKGHAKEDLERLADLGLRFQSKLIQLLNPLRSEINKEPANFGLLRLQANAHWFPIPVLDSPSDKDHQTIAQQYRRAKIYAQSGRHPEVEPLIAEVRALAEGVWNLRGFYGALEIMFRDNVIDWNFIFEVLEIKPSIGKNKIQTDVLKYMKGEKHYPETPGYRELLLAVPTINQQPSTKGLETWLPWNTKNLKPYILGQVSSRNSEKLAHSLSPSEAAKAQTLFASYSIKQKRVFSREYPLQLSEASKQSQSISDHLQAMMKAHKVFFPKKSKSDSLGESFQDEVTHWNKHFFLESQLNLIIASTKPIEKKQEWFNALFFESKPFSASKESTDWFNFKKTLHAVNRYEDELDKALSLRSVSDSAINAKIFEVYKNIFNENTLSFFSKIKEMAVSQDIQDSYYYRAVDASEPFIQSDLQSLEIKTFADLQKIADLLKPIEHRKSIYEKSLSEGETTEIEHLANSETVQFNSARIQRIKATILKRSSALPLSQKQKLQLFLSLTESGPTKETDRFFRSLYNIQSMNEKTKMQVMNYLEEGRFSSDSLRLEFAKLFIGLRLNYLKENVIEQGKKVDRYVLDRLLTDLNRYAPNGSMAKDDFIESIGWSLQLRGSELDGFIEDQKSQNWRRANPMLVRVGSLLASQISAMTFEGRLKTIEYLLDPVNNETTLFNDVFEEMKKIAYNDLLKQAPSQLTV
ncbi:MAG: hypothetical protein RJB66_1261, partial [Pseudomonadota bacterium]